MERTDIIFEGDGLIEETGHENEGFLIFTHKREEHLDELAKVTCGMSTNSPD
jgi:hypothetical protein